MILRQIPITKTKNIIGNPMNLKIESETRVFEKYLKIHNDHQNDMRL